MAAVILAASAAATAAAASSTDEGPTLEFAFQPAYGAVAESPPAIWLDICSDQACATFDQSIPITQCLSRPTPNKDIRALTSCSLIVSDADGPSLSATLRHPADARMRVDNLVSPEFRLIGATSGSPGGLFRFVIRWDSSGLVVSALPKT